MKRILISTLIISITASLFILLFGRDFFNMENLEKKENNARGTLKFIQDEYSSQPKR